MRNIFRNRTRYKFEKEAPNRYAMYTIHNRFKYTNNHKLKCPLRFMYFVYIKDDINDYCSCLCVGVRISSNTGVGYLIVTFDVNNNFVSYVHGSGIE